MCEDGPMGDLVEVLEEFDEQIELIVKQLPRVTANKLGLDSRAGAMYIDVVNRIIVTPISNANSLEYYGGFEYIDSESVTTVRHYRFYGTPESHSRVEKALSFYESHK